MLFLCQQSYFSLKKKNKTKTKTQKYLQYCVHLPQCAFARNKRFAKLYLMDRLPCRQKYTINTAQSYQYATRRTQVQNGVQFFPWQVRRVAQSKLEPILQQVEQKWIPFCRGHTEFTGNLLVTAHPSLVFLEGKAVVLQ